MFTSFKNKSPFLLWGSGGIVFMILLLTCSRFDSIGVKVLYTCSNRHHIWMAEIKSNYKTELSLLKICGSPWHYRFYKSISVLRVVGTELEKCQICRGLLKDTNLQCFHVRHQRQKFQLSQSFFNLKKQF